VYEYFCACFGIDFSRAARYNIAKRRLLKMRNYEIAVLSRGAYARTVRIYAPKKADRAIIMHDGQNAFDDEQAAFKMGWRAVDTLKALGIKNTAVIGVDNGGASREDDYLPFPNELEKYGEKPYGGKARPYVRYLSETVIPYLSKRFGFEKFAMLGSSAGALATLAYAAEKDARVNMYGLFSTPLFVSRNAFDEFFASAGFSADAAYYVYVGGNENETSLPDLRSDDLYVDDAFTVVKALRKSGVKNLKLRLENSAVHNEISWRVPEREFFDIFSKL